jgi:hypothetical protein
MQEQDHSSPTDRSKRPRLEEEVDADYEHNGEEDRHPKRQAVPDPETKAPHFAGDEKKERRSKKWTEGDAVEDSDEDDDVHIMVAGRESHDKDGAERRSSGSSGNDVSLALRSLVGTKDAGIIIGRGGKNVNEIREYSSARVTISGNVPGAYDRILTVNGPVDAVARVSA